jgi:dihydrofolate synthase / folylpolyglutamate synthase
MRYRQLLERLYAARRGGAVLELGRVDRALARLGDLRERLPLVVQVGGTNGKGSTAAFCESILREAGATTGFFSSPHLSRIEERFRVRGELASEDAVLAAGEAIAAADTAGELTFFELVTLIAAQLFADAEVDVAIFEVGLGGRLDATTALGAEVAAVTGISLDHTAILGPDIPSIAREKAGIFRRGQHVVIGCAGRPEARPLLERAAERAGAASVRKVEAADAARLEGQVLGLAGAHQRQNAACALALADAVAAAGGVAAGEPARRRGLARVSFPGRLEQVATAPRVVLDGAHNPDAARALAAALAEMPRARLIAVVGTSADKDAAELLAPVAAQADAIVATAADSDRARAAPELASLAAKLAPQATIGCVESVAAAVARARAMARADDLIVVMGSLFVVGEARVALCGGRRDPLPLSDPAVIV